VKIARNGRSKRRDQTSLAIAGRWDVKKDAEFLVVHSGLDTNRMLAAGVDTSTGLAAIQEKTVEPGGGRTQRSSRVKAGDTRSVRAGNGLTSVTFDLSFNSLSFNGIRDFLRPLDVGANVPRISVRVNSNSHNPCRLVSNTRRS